MSQRTLQLSDIEELGGFQRILQAEGQISRS